MFRTMHVIDSLGVGGAERNLLHMAEYLKGQGVEQVVVHLTGERALAESFAALGIRTVNLGSLPGVLNMGGMYLKTLSFAREWRPSLIVTQLPTSDIVGRFVARQVRVPTVSMWQATRYGPIAATAYSRRVRIVMAAIKYLDRISINQSSRFIAVSKAVESSYLEALGVDSARCQVIPNSVDFSRFPSEAVPRAVGRSEVRFVHVGIHLLRKGIGTLLEAMSLLPRSLNVVVDLLGEGPLTPGLKSYVLNHGLAESVRFRGVIGDVVPELLESDVFVLPSLSEGFSLAYLEALAAGLPVIASDIPENLEVDPERRSTMFFRVGDARALADCLAKLAANRALRSELSGRARGLVSRYRVEQVGPAFLKALRLAAESVEKPSPRMG